MGTPGTKVTVKFGRPGVATPIEVHFTRALIHVPAVRYAISFAANGEKIGYLPLDELCFRRPFLRGVDGWAAPS